MKDSITPLLEAVKRKYSEIVKALINAGARVNDQVPFFKGQSTLLHHAVNCQSNDIVEILLQSNHTVNAKDEVSTQVYY